jgi:hypothetical protein
MQPDRAPAADSTAAARAERLAKAHRRQRRRRRARATAGVILVAYGLAGLLILGSVAIGVSRPLEEVTQLADSLEEQRAGLLASLEETSATIGDAATGVAGMDASLGQARTATDRAATLANDVALTMGEVARSMNVTILGQQPLVGVAGGFERASAQLTSLAVDLGAIGSALGQNTDDAQLVAADLGALRASVDELGDLIGEGPTVAISTGELDAVRLVVYGLIGWLLILALGCIAAGGVLLRAGSARRAGGR